MPQDEGMRQDTIHNKTLSDHTVAVYATHDQAEAAVKTLHDDGYDMNNLSIIGRNFETEDQPYGFVNAGDRMWTWGKFGAFWGAIWGLLFGSALLFIPGIGGIVFAGWFVSALEGALIGGGVGALGGALISIGIPKDSIIEYEKVLKAGSFILMAHGDEAEVKKAKELLAQTHAIRIDSYSTKLEHALTH